MIGEELNEPEGELPLESSPEGTESEEESTEEEFGSEPQGEGLPGSKEEDPFVKKFEGEEVFYDASKVPEELRASFKEMQGQWTRKNQELSLEKMSLEEYKQKSAVYDQLMGDDRVIGFLRQLQEDEARGEMQSQELPEFFDGDPEQFQAVVNLLKQTQKKLSALEDKQRQAETQQTIRSEFEAFVRRHPDWEQYRGAMSNLFKDDRSLSYEAAYRWARDLAYESKRSQAARKKEALSKSTERDGVRPTKRIPKKVTTFDEAVRVALEELNMPASDWIPQKRER